MVTHKEKIHPFFLYLFICAGICGGLLLLLVASFLYSESRPQFYFESKKYVNENVWGIQQILTDIFDQAATCDSTFCSWKNPSNGYGYTDCISPCHESVKQGIYQHLHNTDSLIHFPSTYFIRIKDNSRIEKLFLSGEYKVTQVQTDKEKRVVDYLLGRRIGVNLIDFRINEIYSNMVYLEDFMSEAEFIFPIRKDGKIIGAVVRLYGD